jgi:pyruvate/2-oxoglutarate dehydrogenase complex dihydrolipoamide acyltransferase (E2) component
VPVQIAPGPPPSPTRLNLIPETARSRPLQWRRWQVWAPIAALAIFVVAAVFVPLVQKRQYAVALNIVGAETGQQAQAAANLRTQLEGMEGDYNYILAKKYAYPSVVHVIDEVSRVLPDDTWLTQLEIKTTGRGKDVQREIYLRGESENAGKLIALLEDSKLVEQAAPRSPTTKIQGAAGEIFDLGARLRTLTPPASEQVLAGAAPIPAALVPPPAALAPAPLPAPTAPAPAADTEAEAAPAPPPTRSAPPAAAPAASGFGPFPNAPVAVPQGGQRMQRQVPLAATPQPVAPAPQTAPVPPQAAQAPARAPAATIPPPPPMPAKTPEPSTEIPPAPTMPGTAPSAPEAPPPEPQQPGATN